MRRILLPFVVMLTFFSESIFIDNVATEWFGVELILVPRFLLIMVVFITIFINTATGIYYGMIFGLLYDLIYTDMLGVYLFSIAFVAYLVSLMMKLLHTNFFVVLIMALIGVSILEFLVYGIYLLTGLTGLDFNLFIDGRLIPTLVLNTLFVLFFYAPIKMLLTKLNERNSQEE